MMNHRCLLGLVLSFFISTQAYFDPPIFVVTGGPGIGKTAMIVKFMEVGYPVVQEVATAYLRELLDSKEIESPDKIGDYIHGNRAEFQTEIARRQSAEEAKVRESSASLIVCDRGIIDGLGYLKADKIEAPDEFMQLITFHPGYDAVFLLATLYEYEQGGVRSEDREEAKHVHTSMIRTYQKQGYFLIDDADLLNCSKKADLEKYYDDDQTRPMILIPAVNYGGEKEREIDDRFGRIMACIEKLKKLGVVS